MHSSEFPSALTQVTVKDKNSSCKITLPELELFRVNNIFKDREYEVPRQYLPSEAITVVDVGANVGLFALYMIMTKAIKTIHCFEPSPASVKLLRRNVGNLAGVHIHPFGLTDQDGKRLLMLDPQNTGRNTMIATGAHSATIDVPVQDARSALDRLGLGYIDVLKLDTEGSEVPILESLSSRLDYIGIVLLEYHSEDDRRRIDQLLPQFKLIGAMATVMNLGTLKYINKRLLGEG